jgi:hypothetical protein
MLTIVAGGVLMGLWIGQLSSPVMQFAAQPEWRDRLQPRFSPTPFQFANSAPQDLHPFGPAPGIVPAAYAREAASTLPASAQPALQDAALKGDPAGQVAASAPPQPMLSPAPEPLEVADFGIVPEQ